MWPLTLHTHSQSPETLENRVITHNNNSNNNNYHHHNHNHIHHHHHHYGNCNNGNRDGGGPVVKALGLHAALPGSSPVLTSGLDFSPVVPDSTLPRFVNTPLVARD